MKEISKIIEKFVKKSWENITREDHQRRLSEKRMDKEEDDFCTPHKLFNRFSMCTLPSTTTTQTKMEAGADDSDIRQDLHHSSVVGDHIYNSFMFVVFMHFSLYYWFCIDFVICYRYCHCSFLPSLRCISAINNIALIYSSKLFQSNLHTHSLHILATTEL